MFIPLHDRNALEHVKRPYVTWFFIAANIVFWLLTNALPQDIANNIVLGLGFIPSVAFGDAVLDPSVTIVPADLTALTYAFLHKDFWHLASNMLYLWVFGDNVEDAMGHVRYAIFYCLCAVAGALAHGILASDPNGPLIGASGAISGIVIAYLMLHPKVWVWVLFLFRYPLPLPAVFPLALWVAQQFYFVIASPDNSISWAAHVGGIITGAILVTFMRRRGVPLFDRETEKAATAVHADNTSPRSLPDEQIRKEPRFRWGRS